MLWQVNDASGICLMDRPQVSGALLRLSGNTGIWSGSVVKNLPANAGDMSSIPGSRRSPGVEMSTHSSILARIIPWPEEAEGYSPWGCEELDKMEETELEQAENRHWQIPFQVAFVSLKWPSVLFRGQHEMKDG